MKKSKFTETQIVFALKQAETGTTVAEVCRKLGISEATFYSWKKKYGGLDPAELRRLRQLEEENAQLKRIVADLTLDKQMLQEVLKKSSESAATKDSWRACCWRSIASRSDVLVRQYFCIAASIGMWAIRATIAPCGNA